MCGIVGGIGERNIIPVIVEGLKRLEYRGYDSVGIATFISDNLSRLRVTGRIENLISKIYDNDFIGNVVIGHTRWATHGTPCEKNAHPHFSSNEIGVVHNGIIENYEQLKEELQAGGYKFETDTDTEVIAHLIHCYSKFSEKITTLEAIQHTVDRLRGQFALGIITSKEPNRIFLVKKGSPLIVGLGIREMFFASDKLALLPVTSRFIVLEENDIAIIEKDNVKFVNKNRIVERREAISELTSDMAQLGNFRHYMQKEIFEQPRAISDTLENIIEHGIDSRIFGPDAPEIFKQTSHITIIACGTSYHAGLVAKTWIEEIANIPVNVEIASEYKYRKSATIKNDLIIAVSQSGETADTIQASISVASKENNNYLLSICNVPESTLTRHSDLKFMTRAGQEIGVASTKAFTTQLVAFRILAFCLAKEKELKYDEEEFTLLKGLPKAIKFALSVEPQIHEWAKEITKSNNAIFLGRGIYYPIAEEASLKLKEISYIHAEAFPAGELKHGPLALIDHKMPVICILPKDKLFDKNVSNIEEVAARGGKLFILTQAYINLPHFEKWNAKIIRVPILETNIVGVLDPISAIVPLQLLAYHTALIRGTDVDKPRNLAKSCTVE